MTLRDVTLTALCICLLVGCAGSPLGPLKTDEKEDDSTLKYKACMGSFPTGSSPNLRTEKMLEVSLSSDACADLMPAILSTKSEEELFHSSRDFGVFVGQYFSVLGEKYKGTYLEEGQENPFSKKLRIVSQFSDYLKGKCPDLNKDFPSCKARQSFTESMKSLEKKMNSLLAQEEKDEKEASYRDTPEGLIDQACACDKFIYSSQQLIDRQKEIGKVSGTVNMVTLNNAGSAIVDLKKIKAQISSRYKRVTGEYMRNYRCGNTDELTNPLLWNQGIPVREK